LPDFVGCVRFDVVKIVVSVRIPPYFDPSSLNPIRIPVTIKFNDNEREYSAGVFRADGLDKWMCPCSLGEQL